MVLSARQKHTLTNTHDHSEGVKCKIEAYISSNTHGYSDGVKCKIEAYIN